MKIKVHLSIGLVGCEQDDEIEINDEELAGMDEAARAAYIDEVMREWAYNYIEWYWEEV